jgi:hypothetical protein
VIGGSVLVVSALGATFWFIQSEKQAQAEAQNMASALRGCLYGGPLDEGETGWSRLRRLLLVSMGNSDKERREKAGDMWPFSCKAETIAVRDAIALDLAPGERKAMDNLVRVLGDFSALPVDLNDLAQPALAVLDVHLPGPFPAAREALPPRPRNVDDLKALPSLSPHGSSFQGTYTEENPGLGLPVLVVEDNDPAPLLCVFGAQELTAQCSRFPELTEAKRQGMRLLGTSEDSTHTLIFAGRRGAGGVFVARTSGAAPRSHRVDSLYSFGGSILPDGTVAILGWDEQKNEAVLAEAEPEKTATRTSLKPNFRVGNYFYSSQLLWGYVFVRGVTPDNTRRLFSLAVAGEPKSFDLVDVGDLPEAGLIRRGEEGQTHLSGCRTRETMVIRVRGYDRDFVTFRTGEKFSSLTDAPTWGTLGCSGATATFVAPGFAASGTKLYFASCTPAGCVSTELKGEVLDRNTVDLRPTDERHVQAVALGGKLLVVWIAGESGGLRMRMGEPDLFARAPDTVLLDDRTEGGKKAIASSILGFRLYSRGEFAVFLLSSMSGVHAFRIDPSGSVEPYRLPG